MLTSLANPQLESFQAALLKAGFQLKSTDHDNLTYSKQTSTDVKVNVTLWADGVHIVDKEVRGKTVRNSPTLVRTQDQMNAVIAKFSAA